MKNLKRITVLMAILSFIAFQGFSQNAPATAAQKNTQTADKATPGKFVDNNKDGICDNHQSKMASGKCTTFVDKDGDGKCDNCKGSGNCKGSSNCCGKGCQQGQGQGKGNCSGGGCGKQYRHGCGNQNTTAPDSPKTGDKK